MDPIFDFSAAPHLPPSLRNAADASPRPELLLSALSAALPQTANAVVMERNGELYIEFACAA
ncbi:MAG: hypothetical protein ABL893_10220 [Hyphomicrobium sp.]|nr:hypothetical protein [Hyphomicrobium sp.]